LEWYDDRESFLGELTADDVKGSQRKLAKKMGVSRGLVERRFRRWGLTTTVGRDDEITKQRQKILALSEENSALKKELKALDKNSNVISAITEQIVPYVSGWQMPKVKRPKLPKTAGRPISQLLSLNDWHFGDVVKPKHVQGFNAYDTIIACLRVQKVVDATISVAKDHAGGGIPVDELVVVLNGDMFSGMHNIHPDDALEEGRVVWQMVNCALLTGQAIWELSHHYPEVRVICPAGDNHTRSTRRSPTSSTALEQSWSTPYHELIAFMMANQPHVDVQVHPAYQVFFNVKGWEWAAAHGHGTKGGGGNLGFPAYGISKAHAGNLAKTAALAKMVLRRKDPSYADLVGALSQLVDHTLLGHFHTKLSFEHLGGEVHISPSLKGHDTFTGDILSKLGKSGQALFCIHEENDIMCHHPINTQPIMEHGDTRYLLGAVEGIKPAAEVWQEWVTAQR